MTNFTKFVIFVSCFIFYGAFSQSIVKTLPGYSGNLPFKLETGYISVGESDDIELFYYFIESERNPKDDPLLLWLTGGPGCSGLCGLTFELGPIAFDASSFNGSLPSFVLRQHSWTKIANVIFIDSPVGTGFSYGTKPSSYNFSDTLSTADTYTFLRKWLLSHRMFIENDMYIAGDSYAGKIVPIVVHEILKGNKVGLQPQMLLQGYLIGNPVTDHESDENEKIPYAHGMALIPTEYYESAKRSCFGQYVNPDPSNAQCLHALELINECMRDIYRFHILEPTCTGKKRGAMFLEDDWQDILVSIGQGKSICRDDMNYMMSYAWANNQEVQDALRIRKGTIREWTKCSTLIIVTYDKNVASAVPYHQLLTHQVPKALVYSGDHDLSVPYLATLKWIRLLNLTVDDGWRPWKVNGQIAGYTQRYKKDGFYFTFATVKGAGHTVPEYKPEESLAMVDRWISSDPL